MMEEGSSERFDEISIEGKVSDDKVLSFYTMRYLFVQLHLFSALLSSVFPLQRGRLEGRLVGGEERFDFKFLGLFHSA